MPSFSLPLDSANSEVIVIPFFDIRLAPFFTCSIQAANEVNVTTTQVWCWRSVAWDNTLSLRQRLFFKAFGEIRLKGFDTLILAFTASKDIRLRVRLLEKTSSWSEWIDGKDSRRELEIPLKSIYSFFSFKERTVKGIEIEIDVPANNQGSLSLAWVGLRNSVTYKQIVKNRPQRTLDWSAWILPETAWNLESFRHNIVFSVEELQLIQQKKKNKYWVAHFQHLEKAAQKYLQRNPEESFGEYLPNHDERYIRERDQGQTCYHWEALTLAFVGLVNQDSRMINHALRYLMCMVHTPVWSASAEQELAGSTWNELAFMAEMTCTSVVLLTDWLAGALSEAAHLLIAKAVWEKGITPVRRDLMVYPHMHKMNQGVVFNRACILGGLLLEKTWGHVPAIWVDQAYTQMKEILGRYLRTDGGICEGPAYFGQMGVGVSWAVLAYCRARNLDWKSDLSAIFSNADRFIEVMSSTNAPGTTIPFADCRGNMFGGDLIALIATLFPDGACAKILGNCLEQGSIFQVSGTLSRSGGLIGMVYGPDNPIEATIAVPEFSYLPESAKISCYRKKEGLETRFWMTGNNLDGAHTHKDQGSFVLEANGINIFIERGMVEYWKPAAFLLSKTEMHNTITLCDSERQIYLDQQMPQMPCTVSGSLHEAIFKADVDMTAAYADCGAKQIKRTILSNTVDTFVINDCVETDTAYSVAFHLQSLVSFSIHGLTCVTVNDSITTTVSFPWATHISSKIIECSYSGAPVHRLTVLSVVANKHCLETTICVEKNTN